jgi:hypothetical protein
MAVVKRRGTTKGQAMIRLAQQSLLRDKIPPPEANPFVVFNFHIKGEALWREHGDEVLAEWVLEKPGTRPLCWWLYSCPITVPKSLLKDVNRRACVWARHPKYKTPDTKQREFLAKHRLLTEGE